MEILNLRLTPPGGNAIARFDAQLVGMRLYNLTLKRGQSGYRVYGPSAFGAAAVTFTPETAMALISAALGEIAKHDRSAA